MIVHFNNSVSVSPKSAADNPEAACSVSGAIGFRLHRMERRQMVQSKRRIAHYLGPLLETTGFRRLLRTFGTAFSEN